MRAKVNYTLKLTQLMLPINSKSVANLRSPDYRYIACAQCGCGGAKQLSSEFNCDVIFCAARRRLGLTANLQQTRVK